MSQTIATAICETNKKAGLNQENVFFNGVFRQPSEYSVPFIKNIRSSSPIQVYALFSAQGKDSVAATTLKKVLDQFAVIVGAFQKATDPQFDIFVDETVRRLNDLVCQNSLDNNGNPVRISMTAAVIQGDEIRLMSLGNTRAYLYRKSRFIALTEDQTVAHRYVQMGAITKEEELKHPERSVLTQYLGRFPQDGLVIPEKKIHFKLIEGDEIFLFGTGITHMVEPPVLGITAAKSALPNIKAAEFISSAKQSGAKGGLTVISMQIEKLTAVVAAAGAAAVATPIQTTADAQSDDEAQMGEEQTDNLEQEDQIVLSAKEKRKKRLKAVLIPVGILMCCFLLGYLSMFVLMNSGRWFAKDIEGTVDEGQLINRVMYALGDHLPVYAEDDLESAVLGYLERGEPVMLLSQDGAFSRVILENGTDGYVVSIMLSGEDPTIGEAIPTMDADPTPVPTTSAPPPTTTVAPVETTTTTTTAMTESTSETTTETTTEENTTDDETDNETDEDETEDETDNETDEDETEEENTEDPPENPEG